MTRMLKLLHFSFIIVIISPSINKAHGTDLCFTKNHSKKLPSFIARNQSGPPSLKRITGTNKSTSTSNWDITTKYIHILSLSASSKNSEQDNKIRLQQKFGYRQIGGPIQQSVAEKISKDNIETLILSRTKARRKRNFARADEILQTLGDAGIFINDSEKVWRADGYFSVDVENDGDGTGAGETPVISSNAIRHGGGGKMSYVKSEKSKYISDDDTKYVLKKLEQRSQAKSKKDYMTADTILDELRYLFYIEVNDNLKTWCVLGEEKSAFLKGDYVFGGKRIANIPENDRAAIEDLIKQRVEARKRKDYKIADAILSDLKVQYSVRVDDKKKQWHIF